VDDAADLVEEMHGSLARTQNILPALKEAGVVDSGGAGLLYIVEGFYRVLCGEKVEALPQTEAPRATKVVLDGSFGPDSVMEYGYCTEFLLQLQNAKTDIEHFDVDVIKQFLVEVGNSVVCFQTGSVVKVHVHTMTPEKVLGFCREFGEFLTVKIENMSVQHSENPEAPKAEKKPEAKKPRGEKKKYALVAAVNGAGLASLFTEMGVDAIVEGGQTSNPSTQDFLAAFEEIWAENIIILPNNSNIIMAANQAASIYEEAKVFVLPSKNVGKGYTALTAFDPFAETPEELLSAMEAAMGNVSAGFVSPAIRDAQMNGVEIHNGDFIGFVDKEILFSAERRFEVAEELALHMMKEDGRFMLTVFCGKDAPEEERSALEETLTEDLPDAEIYFMEGGQDIYPYIFVAE
jgi:DAK2 domain fusion protein YloV